MSTDKIFCDAVILCPLDVEFKSLQNALNKQGWRQSSDSLFSDKKLPFKTQPLEYRCNISNKDYSSSKRSVVVIKLKEQGVMAAAIETSLVINLFDCFYIVSFGVAGGIKDVAIGDVIFPTTLVYYEPAKYSVDNGKPITENNSRQINMPDRASLRPIFYKQ
jgi:nucleoside phosphorylase